MGCQVNGQRGDMSSGPAGNGTEADRSSSASTRGGGGRAGHIPGEMVSHSSHRPSSIYSAWLVASSRPTRPALYKYSSASSQVPPPEAIPLDCCYSIAVDPAGLHPAPADLSCSLCFVNGPIDRGRGGASWPSSSVEDRRRASTDPIRHIIIS